jgi:hypothetical protein
MQQSFDILLQLYIKNNVWKSIVKGFIESFTSLFLSTGIDG